MVPIAFDLVGFDLDGTLLDTSGELTASVNFTLGQIGRAALTRDDVRPMVGLGAKHMLAEGIKRTGAFDDAMLAQWLPVLLEHYEAHLGNDSPPFAGLLELMAALDDHGVKMAVVTNKYERFAVKLLREIGLLGRFACVIGGDTMGPGKAKPHRAPMDEMARRCGVQNPARAAFLGDSIYDVMAAKAAGLRAIAVSFGFLHQPINELGADAIVDHYDEVLPLLAAWSQVTVND
jgi:phosphoglycolate phosphatase